MTQAIERLGRHLIDVGRVIFKLVLPVHDRRSLQRFRRLEGAALLYNAIFRLEEGRAVDRCFAAFFTYRRVDLQG